MYKDYNDYELVEFVCENNESAYKILIDKYKPLVFKIAQQFYDKEKVKNIELTDLMQEGFLAINQAIYTFSESKDVLFYTYVSRCITRKILSTINSEKSRKNKLLNEALSIEQLTNGSGDFCFIQSLNLNPEKIMEDTENYDILKKRLKKVLTLEEQQLINLKIQGFTYKEISDKLKVELKTVYYLFQRIRFKIKKMERRN